ncbi:MAG: hypothetical protein JWM68_233 [Verrucomicrobiales bacterium]|nr:hypothetical protein [Verrucomicrobiales bacterium]
MSVMTLEQIQPFVKALIDAHPQFLAKGVTAIIDDGTYPKLPGLEKALQNKGLAIIVWELMGLPGESAATGLSNLNLHIAIVIKENIKLNSDVHGTGIHAKTAMQYVLECVPGNPKRTPPGTPIKLHDEEPFEIMEIINGVRTIVVNFTKEHRINPI